MNTAIQLSAVSSARMDRKGFTRRLNQAYQEKALSEARLGQKFNQRVLAGVIGMSQGSVYSYLKGLKVPRALVIARLGEALGVTPGWLTYGVGGAVEAPSPVLDPYCVGVALKVVAAAPPSLSDEGRDRIFIEIYTSEFNLRQLGVGTSSDSEDSSFQLDDDKGA